MIAKKPYLYTEESNGVIICHIIVPKAKVSVITNGNGKQYFVGNQPDAHYFPRRVSDGHPLNFSVTRIHLDVQPAATDGETSVSIPKAHLAGDTMVQVVIGHPHHNHKGLLVHDGSSTAHLGDAD